MEQPNRSGMPWVAVGVGCLALTVLSSVALLCGGGFVALISARSEGPAVAASATAASPSAVEVAPDRPAVVAEPARPAIIAVRSDPTGAEVWVSGARLGVTPLDYSLAAGESASLEVRLSGYHPATTAVGRVEPGESRTILVSLEPDAAPLRARAANRPRPHRRPGSADPGSPW